MVNVISNVRWTNSDLLLRANTRRDRSRTSAATAHYTTDNCLIVDLTQRLENRHSHANPRANTKRTRAHTSLVEKGDSRSDSEQTNGAETNHDKHPGA